MLRHRQHWEAKEALKKARLEIKKQNYFNESVQKLLTEEDRKNGVLGVVGEKQKAPSEQAKYGICEVIEQFVKEKMQVQAWTQKTKEDYKTFFNFFSEVLKDRVYFDKLKYDDLNFYKDRVLHIPKNWKTNPKYKNKTIDQIMEMKNVETISNNTRRKHFDTIKSLFTWAVENGKTDHNYASGLKIVAKSVGDDDRKKFSKEDLQKIISSDEYTLKNGKRHKKAAYFWIPLISMFTGARINELCQLKVADIQQENGIWFFSINVEDGKTVKTKAAIRKIPIHKTLIALGFLNFHESQKKNNETQLFSELTKHKQHGYGASFGRWFNDRYLIDCGVRDEKKTIKKTHHSFRHTLIHHFQQLGIEEKRYKAIVGHKDKDLSYYQHGFDLKVLADEVIAKIDFGLDFSHLMDKKRNEYL